MQLHRFPWQRIHTCQSYAGAIEINTHIVAEIEASIQLVRWDLEIFRKGTKNETVKFGLYFVHTVC